MRICYFGTYEKDYPRNRIVIRGLRRSGIEVVECHFPLWERREDKTGGFLSAGSLLVVALRLIRAYLVLAVRFFRAGSFDCLMVGYIGQMDIFLARFLLMFRRRPLIFNPLVSLYDTLVIDRGIFRRGSITAGLLFRIDRWSLQLADHVILDTNAHIDYISGLFGIDRAKFIRVFVGADEDIFFPREAPERDDGSFRVLFYGKFIPLHGIHHILHAAKALEGDPTIRFRIIGRGQLSGEIHALAGKLDLKNVEFVDWVPYEKLPEEIAAADLCLGIFGDTEKTQRVIPNKLFQALACGRQVLTLDTPAVRELGPDRSGSLYTVFSPGDLVGVIRYLALHPSGPGMPLGGDMRRPAYACHDLVEPLTAVLGCL
ncbi:MAG: glycosyltransferase family 4 protein [Deltaproteobacteria bacterium]|nr:glycosyltransferase family 4 protein [Deltaproteobacteria bacterium]